MKLLKFYTNTCGQCKALSKILENFNLIPVEAINCEEDPEDLTTKFNIRSLPTLLLVDNDKILKKFIGVATKEELESVITQELNKNKE